MKVYYNGGRFSPAVVADKGNTVAAVAAAAVAVAAIWHCRTGNSRTEVFIAVEDSVIVRLTIHQGPTHPQTYIAISGARCCCIFVGQARANSIYSHWLSCEQLQNGVCVCE